MVYCAGKLIVYLKLFYKSNRPHFLWVYKRDNPLGMLGEHSKSRYITRLGSWRTSFSSVLPTSPVGYHASKPIEGVVYCLSKEPRAKTNFIRSPNPLVFFSRLNSGNTGHQFWRAFKLISWTVSKEDIVKPRYNESLYKEVSVWMGHKSFRRN